MIPIRTSISPRRTPYVNYALIAVNAIMFVMTLKVGVNPLTHQYELALKSWAEQFMLVPSRPDIWQFVTYAFLHGGVLHILGNMYFLYMFGNNVNDRLGHVGYLCFYLAGAVFSGIGHTLLHENPVLGASGAVAAVTGAYLVLFPGSVITVLYWFLFIGTIELSALYFIVFKLIFWDNMIERQFAAASVAYEAHLAGYVFGMATVLGLLATGLIERNYSDLWSMIKQWNRRRRFRDTVAEGYDPFSGRGSQKARRIEEDQRNQAISDKQQKTAQLKEQVIGLIGQRNIASAARQYLELVNMGEDVILSRQYQLDIGNQLMSMGMWAESAAAYEKYLSAYGSFGYAEQVELMLGVLYSRYLNRPNAAIEYLKRAYDKLNDAGQKKLCMEELEKLGG